LDEVSAGEREWKAVLREFWKDFIAKIDESKQLKITEVLEALDHLLAAYAFGTPKNDGHDPRECAECKTRKLASKLGRFVPYISFSNYPDSNHKTQIGESNESIKNEDGTEFKLPKPLGQHPESGDDIVMKKGPYGLYVQLGEGKTPKR